MTSSVGGGSPAPSIEALDWLRGEPLSNFQLGKIHILEFFSTICKPCGPALAHLAQLQEQYRDVGIEVIGIAANEQAATADDARAQLDAWLTRLPHSKIRIAFDSSGNKHWMDASLSFHVPQAFVVDRDGSIAFIGGPDALEDVLPKVIDGSWRARVEAKNAEKERIAEGEIDAMENALHRRIRAATDIEDWKSALSVIAEGINLFPDRISLRQSQVSTLIGEMRDMESGLIALAQFARDAIERNSEDWLLAAMEELFGPHHDYSELPFAERLSLSKELSERILILCAQQDALSRAQSYQTIAHYYNESGDNGMAVGLIELALNLVDGGPLPDEVKQEWLAHLLRVLTEYKGEAACYGGICMPPPK
ncbi:TlpA family protein disulfide reductase [Rhizobium leguminosarum]|uniref:TlpA family protein disulfide reductase n=1 Tax=Rhizobium leguminosarum TaxID=384 RepID=UPI001C925452|nr:TlpA disulfide reductase family protein [Rhizobium leguminosarum]MBY3004088.1 TlpA family protein disulfide reductase [Rhizobium leguminosarum]MBY3027454.1 TlpA family protein disulfide reductase [Rhizobium leguminosarum]